MTIHLNFDGPVNPLDFVQHEQVGNLEVKVDPVTERRACYFDGASHLKFPFMEIGRKDFSIELMFRAESQGKERGIFGSTGYRLALRQDKNADSFSFWAHFPSSIDQKRQVLHYEKEDALEEHYFGLLRQGDTFTVRLDNQLHTMEYSHDYWSYQLYLGMYYDKLYSFIGYIRQFRFDTEELADIYRPIPGSIFQ